MIRSQWPRRNLCGVLCDLCALCGYNPLSAIRSSRFAIRYISKATIYPWPLQSSSGLGRRSSKWLRWSGSASAAAWTTAWSPLAVSALVRGIIFEMDFSFRREIFSLLNPVLQCSRMRFKVIIINGEDGWLVIECPSLPGCISQGRIVEEALENIKDAIQGCLNVFGDRTTSDPIELLRWRPW